MWIDVKIPYEPLGQLAYAYNRAIRESTAPWVLLLDHDIFLGLNPYWYAMSLKAIKKAPPRTGMITCTMNGRKDLPQQPEVIIDKSPNIDRHVELAKKAYMSAKDKLIQATNTTIAGYFMLVNREAWNEIKFKDQGKGVNKVDHTFCKDLLANNWQIQVMKGLYVYHHTRVRKLKW